MLHASIAFLQAYMFIQHPLAAVPPKEYEVTSTTTYKQSNTTNKHNNKNRAQPSPTRAARTPRAREAAVEPEAGMFTVRTIVFQTMIYYIG